MSAGPRTSDTQNNSYRKKKQQTWTIFKETTGRILSWERNRSFIGI